MREDLFIPYDNLLTCHTIAQSNFMTSLTSYDTLTTRFLGIITTLLVNSTIYLGISTKGAFLKNLVFFHSNETIYLPFPKVGSLNTWENY